MTSKVYKNGTFRKLSKEEIEKIKQLYINGMSTYELAKKFKVSYHAIWYHLQKHKIKRRNKSEATTLAKNKNLRLEKSPYLAYLIGVYLGDGSIDECKSRENYRRFRFRVKSPEKAFIDSIAKACKNIGLYPHILKCNYPYYLSNKNWRIPYELVVYSKPFCLFMLKMKNINELSKMISGYELNFLRGIYESEGSVIHEKGKMVALTAITNTNKELAIYVAKLLLSIGFTPHITVDEPKNKKYKTVYHVRLNAKQGKKFLAKIKPIIKYD